MSKLSTRHAAALARATAAHTVTWTPEMLETLFYLYVRGDYIPAIAEKIGVCSDLVVKQLRQHNLPNRQRTTAPGEWAAAVIRAKTKLRNPQHD